jgi:hypothetical protein
MTFDELEKQISYKGFIAAYQDDCFYRYGDGDFPDIFINFTSHDKYDWDCQEKETQLTKVRMTKQHRGIKYSIEFKFVDFDHLYFEMNKFMRLLREVDK